MIYLIIMLILACIGIWKFNFIRFSKFKCKCEKCNEENCKCKENNCGDSCKCHDKIEAPNPYMNGHSEKVTAEPDIEVFEIKISEEAPEAPEIKEEPKEEPKKKEPKKKSPKNPKKKNKKK